MEKKQRQGVLTWMLGITSLALGGLSAGCFSIYLGVESDSSATPTPDWEGDDTTVLTGTPEVTPSATPETHVTPEVSPTLSPEPTERPTPTATPTQTPTATPTPTPEPTPTPTMSPTPVATPSPSPTPPLCTEDLLQSSLEVGYLNLTGNGNGRVDEKYTELVILEAHLKNLCAFPYELLSESSCYGVIEIFEGQGKSVNKYPGGCSNSAAEWTINPDDSLSLVWYWALYDYDGHIVEEGSALTAVVTWANGQSTSMRFFAPF